jgi:beta-glucuronidase
VDILAWPGYPRQRTYARFDALGLNSYFGWYEGRGGRTADLADLEPFLRRARADYWDQALVMTEFGAESTTDGPVVMKETYAFQAGYVRANLDVIERLPFMGGAIYWTLREFAVKPNWDGGARRTGVVRDAIHNKGLVTYADGRRKPAWAVAARAFAATPLYRSPAPWEVAPGLDARPPAPAASPWAVLLVAALAGALLALAATIVRLVRGLLRAPAPAPAAAVPDGQPERVPIRMAA